MKPVLSPETVPGGVHVSPNPFGQDGTWISAQEAGLLEIFDLNGKRLWSGKVPKSEAFHLDSRLFPHAGVYFWHLGSRVGKLVFAP